MQLTQQQDEQSLEPNQISSSQFHTHPQSPTWRRWFVKLEFPETNSKYLLVLTSRVAQTQTQTYLLSCMYQTSLDKKACSNSSSAKILTNCYQDLSRVKFILLKIPYIFYLDIIIDEVDLMQVAPARYIKRCHHDLKSARDIMNETNRI